MSLSTYSDLQTQVANWLHRSDLTAYIPDFITLFEAAAARKLRVRPMEVTTTLTPSVGSVALPVDYLGWRRLTWTGSARVELQYVHPSILQAYFPDSPTDTPSMFTIEGGNILIRPLDTTALEFVYYAKNGALSSTLNWLYTNHPDIYLFGTLAEAQGFKVDADKLALWKARRDEIFDEIEKLNFRENGSMQMKVRGPVI